MVGPSGSGGRFWGTRAALEVVRIEARETLGDHRASAAKVVEQAVDLRQLGLQGRATDFADDGPGLLEVRHHGADLLGGEARPDEVTDPFGSKQVARRERSIAVRRTGRPEETPRFVVTDDPFAHAQLLRELPNAHDVQQHGELATLTLV
nr:hypothetical protein [Labilithrix luteola]